MLSPRLQLKVAQKQILTPGLVQMVTVLQLNRLELKDMISQEISQNPVLEEAVNDGTEELSPEEVQAELEVERDPAEPAPADQGILEVVNGAAQLSEGVPQTEPEALEASATEGVEPKATDPFEEIDFGTFFDDYLDPGYRSPAAETVEKPSFETFLSAPVTLSDHLHSQLSVLVLSDSLRDAAELIIGNLDEKGYLSAALEELAEPGESTAGELEEALKVVQSLDPAGPRRRGREGRSRVPVAPTGGPQRTRQSCLGDRFRPSEDGRVKAVQRARQSPRAASGARSNRRSCDPRT